MTLRIDDKTSSMPATLHNKSVMYSYFAPLLICCPSSCKMGHQTGLSLGASGSSVVLIMQPAFDVANGDIVLSVF